MPLSRQLGLSLLAVLILVFIGTLWINANNTRDFVDQQLASHAQDTATSLGLSIAPYMANEEDLPVVDTMMNAIFDRGFYQSMVLKDAKQNVLLEKHNPNSVEGVPLWFRNLLPLTPPESTTDVNDGWTIAGTLTVKSHPGFGYQQLWLNATQAFRMILAVFIVALILLYALVRMITTPLLAVVKQADAISKQQFEQIGVIPRTPELKRIVVAVNRMSAQLAKLFNQLSNQAERYRDFAYKDQLTGVANRRAFELAFEQLLADSEQHAQGYLLLVRLTSLNEVNTNLGYQAGDEYVKLVGQELQSVLAQADLNGALYRVSGADFVVLLEDTAQQACIAFTQSIIAQLNAIEKSEYRLGTAHVGVGSFSFGDTRTDVLERADNALSGASVATDRWQLAQQKDQHHSNTEWRTQLNTILQQNHADFVAQPIKNRQGETLYNEWFARFSTAAITGRGDEALRYLPMGQLVPASVRLNYAQKLDELLIASALTQLSSHNHAIGLNVSRLSLSQTSFHQWLIKALPQDNAACANLVLEIPERALVNGTEELTHFIAQLKSKGVRITVERFGAQLAAITHLRKIKPDYLKLDGRFVRNIHNEPDNQLFVQSLVNIAHGLNIQVIAEMVEDEAEARCLLDLFVDHLQGYHIGMPTDTKV
ncbi:MAG: GGDEF domain-containing protein [Alteromonadaceae bacterium]|uniref:bifunctional diguanylate cyclase/phosphodiesterase n=1 Tax=Paraglaciecola chathamensis TaxID=368405 RepID=UPI000C445C9B|nr:EAL domain-containing protein [Paraglaciecola agarilytica]MBN24182.1 GGDEF domain-containing protein [Alteromonadaceae bacterium]|tara:strand:+ start:21370 stop:23325 length:1956 start_codon:yes stop_codon:yes gene_type:complete